MARRKKRKPGRPSVFHHGGNKDRFLAVLSETGNISKACEAIGVQRQIAINYKNRHPIFATEWQSAVDSAVDVLEAEARRRGLDGWEEPVFQRGMQVGTVRKYSDQLLLAQLKALRRETYGDQRAVMLTTPPGQPLQLTAVPTKELVDRLAHIEKILVDSGVVSPIKALSAREENEADEELRTPIEAEFLK